MDGAVSAYGWTDLNPTCEFLLDYEDEGDQELGFGAGSLSRMIKSTAHYPDERIVSALSAQFESASSPPDPALEFLEDVQAKIQAEPGEELPGGQGGQFAGACDQFGLGSFPHMFPGRQGDPVFTA